LYTSTAVPIGEEFRVINYADKLLQSKKNGEANMYTNLRISLTNANSKRVEAIKAVIGAMHNKPFSDWDVSITDNKNDHEARTGKKWEQDWNDLDDWDIIGPNCRDDVVVGVRSVDCVIMEGSSNERPKGESRFPVLDDSGGEAQIYTIPHHTQKSDNFVRDMFDLYPNTKITEIRLENGVSTPIISEREIVGNPHRAFLRMVGVASALIEKYGADKIPAKMKKEYKKKLSQDIQLVQGYIDSGANNKAMETFLDYFKGNGYI
jgi:hypothetical protein